MSDQSHTDPHSRLHTLTVHFAANVVHHSVEGIVVAPVHVIKPTASVTDTFAPSFSSLPSPAAAVGTPTNTGRYTGAPKAAANRR